LPRELRGDEPLAGLRATSTPNDEAVDAMPADCNDDQRVNVTDRTRLVLALKAGPTTSAST
jgi:hypothetical protein